MKSKKAKYCADCRDGEHDNYDDDTIFVVVRDPNKEGRGKIIKRSYMCAHHREIYLDDGYEVKEQ